MKTNDRIRKRVAAMIDADEQIVATVQCHHSVYNGGTSGIGGTAGQVNRIFEEYQAAAGLDPTHGHRYDLWDSWCTLTDRRVVFHKSSWFTLRPGPKKLVGEFPRASVRLNYQDGHTYNRHRIRIVDFRFPDDEWVVQWVGLGATARSRPDDDEAQLLLDGLGDAATEISKPPD